MAEQIDHSELALSRLATQYKDSVNLAGYISALLYEANELELTLQELLTERWIETAVGFQLDVLGDIVGQLRTIEEVIANPYFGYVGAIGAREFDTIDSNPDSANFRSISDIEFQSEILDDDTYRLFIRAKIEKNETKTSIDETIEILSFIVPDFVIEITEQDTSFKAGFLGNLTDRQKLILARTDYTPKPIGVSALYYDNEGIFA